MIEQPRNPDVPEPPGDTEIVVDRPRPDVNPVPPPDIPPQPLPDQPPAKRDIPAS